MSFRIKLPGHFVCRRAVVCAALVVGLVVSTCPAGDGPTGPARPIKTGKVCRVQSFALNKFIPKLDGQWQGSCFASDGNVYFASSTHAHDHGAAVFKYDPRTDKLTMLCEDISRVCGEDPTKQVPQGKIHSDFVERNGWIYFATHLANYWQPAASDYTGAHLVGLEMATGKFKDFGVLKEKFSCYSGIGVDPKGRYAWTVLLSWAKDLQSSAGTHIARTDLRTGKTVDYGKVPSAGRRSCAYVFVDNRADCWFTLNGGDGTLYVARAATGKIESFKGAFATTGRRRGAWTWGQGVGDGERFLFTQGDDLRELNVAKMPNVKAAIRTVATIGPTGLALALTKDRLYYQQRASKKRHAKGDDHHLMSVSLAPGSVGKIIDHGLVVDQAGRRPWRYDSLAADGAGKVFIVGDWHLNDGEEGTHRLSYRWKPGQPIRYDRLRRGQFFAVANVAKDLPKKD